MQASFRLCYSLHHSYPLWCGLFLCYSGAGSSILFNTSEICWAGLWNRACPFLKEDSNLPCKKGALLPVSGSVLDPKAHSQVLCGVQPACEHSREKDPIKSTLEKVFSVSHQHFPGKEGTSCSLWGCYRDREKWDSRSLGNSKFQLMRVEDHPR